MSKVSTVYGPVESWRVGRSLGVDLLCVNSICSFRCVYCQLGRIGVHTSARRVYVPTARVLEDLEASAWRGADVLTLSGSGEPTLAANMGEVIAELKTRTRKPVLVLTNSAHLNDAEVRRDLCGADRVFCKLDAADEETFRRVNRAAAGLSLGSVVGGIKKFRGEYAGRLAVQLMLLPLNSHQARGFARLLEEIRPDEVQLNAPRRAVPRAWSVDARDNHGAAREGVRLKTVCEEEARRFAELIRRETSLEVVTATA